MAATDKQGAILANGRDDPRPVVEVGALKQNQAPPNCDLVGYAATAVSASVLDIPAEKGTAVRID